MKAAIVLAGLFLLFVSSAHARPIFNTYSEAPTKTLSVPSAKVADVVIGSLTKFEVGNVNECIADRRLKPRDYRQLLREAVFEASPGHRLHVVRGSNERDSRCYEFYGAHLFIYYVIDESVRDGKSTFRIVFQNGGDGLVVHSDIHRGLNDIEARGCVVGECSVARMAFDGRSYRPVRCSLVTMGKQREIVTPRRCGSDGFQDYQSSGFVQRQKR